MKKFMFLFAAMLTAMLSFNSCKKDNPDAIAVILKNQNSDYWKQIAKAVEDECKNYGVTPLIYFNNLDGDADAQLAAIAALGKAGSSYNIKGVIVAPVFSQGDHRVEVAVKNFAGTNIPVVVIDTPLDDNVSPLTSICKAYVGTDNRTAGEQLAATIGADLAPTVMAARVSSSAPAKERYEGFCSVMRQEIPLWETDGADTPENFKKQLANYPDVCNVVFMNGTICESVISATDGLGVFTFDVHKSFLEDLKDGSSSIRCVVAQDTFEMGSNSVKAIFRNSGDKKVFIPTFNITRDNLKSAKVKPYLDYFNIVLPD